MPALPARPKEPEEVRRILTVGMSGTPAARMDPGEQSLDWDQATIGEGGGDVDPDYGRHRVGQVSHVPAVDAVHSNVVGHFTQLL